MNRLLYGKIKHSNTERKKRSKIDIDKFKSNAGLSRDPVSPIDACSDEMNNEETPDIAIRPDSEQRMSREARWEDMFQRLLKFRKKHGHCVVPNRYKEDRQLGTWVSTQRRHYKSFLSGPYMMTMAPERAKRLCQIGFDWSAKDKSAVLRWETQFQKLLEYVIEHGHSLVPIGWYKNPQLANWVSTQRQEYKALGKGGTSSLNCKRVRLLNAIGFVWEAPLSGLGDVRKAILESKPDDELLSPIQKTASFLLTGIKEKKLPTEALCASLTNQNKYISVSSKRSCHDGITAKVDAKEDNGDALSIKQSKRQKKRKKLSHQKTNFDTLFQNAYSMSRPTISSNVSPPCSNFHENQTDTASLIEASKPSTSRIISSDDITTTLGSNFQLMANALQNSNYINSFSLYGYPNQTLPTFSLHQLFSYLNLTMNQSYLEDHKGLQSKISALNAGIPIQSQFYRRASDIRENELCFLAGNGTFDLIPRKNALPK